MTSSQTLPPAAVQVWGQLFEQDFGALPELITGPCCAEFMVSRERILSHSRYMSCR